MKRQTSLSRLCVITLSSATLFAGGCRDGDDQAHDNATQSGRAESGAVAGDTAAARGPEISITGCLTANIDGRSYALTPSDTSATASERSLQVPGRETVTYELVGNGEDFRSHVNSVVTVRGREDASARREADVERKDKAEQPASAGAKDTPTVETKEEVEVNVRRLHADSVVATGNACPSITPGRGGSTDAPKGATGTTQGASASRPAEQRR
jgi:hypothetical protein